MNYYTETTRERNQRIKLQAFARQFAESILGKQPEDVPELFAAMKPPRGFMKYDVFQILDEKPGLFSGVGGAEHYSAWHSVLRRARNTPSIGKKLFEAINAK